MERHGIDTKAFSRSLYRRLFGSNLISAGILGIAFFLTPKLWGPISIGRFLLWNVVGFSAYTVFGSGVAVVINRRLFSPTRRWIERGTPDEPASYERVFRLPFLYAIWSLVFWSGSLIWIPLVDVDRLFAPGHFPFVRLSVSLALGGFLAFFYCFLLIDLKLRPLYALAPALLERGVPTAHRLSTRLILLWIASGGSIAISVSLILIGLSPARAYTARGVIWALCALAATVGPVVFFIAARTITSTVGDVQRAFRAVADGDLNTELLVDNPTELGHLQAGFNTMVAGLRERRTLEDLFGRHVGTEVARYALAQGTELRGEMRLVSVLFVDIIGSSRLAQAIPPTEVVDLLNRFFATVVRVLASNGGWVNKFEGDGALAIFGAPADQPDHAARALRAAREMRVELDALERDHPQLRAAIGVSSGEVVAGNVGAAERYEYAVIGDAVNEASRVTDEAKTRAIKLLATSSAVASAHEESDHWRPAGEVELRGREGATELYELYA